MTNLEICDAHIEIWCSISKKQIHTSILKTDDFEQIKISYIDFVIDEKITTKTHLTDSESLIIIICQMEREIMQTVDEWGLRAKSKKEIYRLMVNDGKIYFTPIAETNSKFIRSILTRKKKVITRLLLFSL